MKQFDAINYPIVLYRGESRPVVFVYRPFDNSLPPYNLTGQTVELRIKPDAGTEIIFGTPEISITNATGGEITINLTTSDVNGFTFQNARYVVLLNGKRLIAGQLTIKSLYE